MSDPRSLSLWLDQLPESLDPRAPLAGDTDVDVAIVGGGFTGLWTAYYLLGLDPSLRVLVVEREICGFGASGRNGGWCVGELASRLDAVIESVGRDVAVRQMREVFRAVDEVGRVAELEGISCGYTRGGAIYVARNQAQMSRLRREVDYQHSLGITADEIRWLDADEARAEINATDVLGGYRLDPCAAIDPAALVRGLAAAVERAGGRIVEQTAARSVAPGQVVTDHGVIRANVVVRATEAYTKSLDGHRRTLVPLYSLMIATEPLDRSTWDEIGLARRPTFSDGRHHIIYGQRTADGRLAFGGRGAPYAYASRIDPRVEHHSDTHDLIHRTLIELFPAVAGAEITHRWGGVLGVPRDWQPSVVFDRVTGMASGGGYVGEGVAASNVAGRTLAELITGTDSERTELPWVGHRSRRWEPEPLRWLGINAGRRIIAAADRVESRTNREAKRAKWFLKLLR
jgi:glycine/D-amino acid oxidase-like deaminating enzyme